MTAEPLDELRRSLHATQRAAERLAAEVPPQGWASDTGRNLAVAEIEALLSVLATLCGLIPDDLWDQVREVARRLVALLATILEVVVQRLSAPRPRPAAGGDDAAVQDIPIF
ncbi:hypothetical protein FSW04_22950 [Baekduia soli]|uniref:Uncharacterized protein n=1 Tax=Baekduia soli TaxID=496014 RepID=A0A5B8UAQ0_9ACTN|nr:hypothetical protein [Baekduia soli]QEC50150.1 hypothetical protein FSW04_22950 [Baekduia soli]